MQQLTLSSLIATQDCATRIGFQLWGGGGGVVGFGLVLSRKVSHIIKILEMSGVGVVL